MGHNQKFKVRIRRKNYRKEFFVDSGTMSHERTREQQFQATGFILHYTIRKMDEMIEFLENPLLPVQNIEIIIAQLRSVRQMLANSYDHHIEQEYPRNEN